MNTPRETPHLWDHQAGVRRYRRLLQTPLTEIERRFVEQRLAEEQSACRETMEIDHKPSDLFALMRPAII